MTAKSRSRRRRPLPPSSIFPRESACILFDRRIRLWGCNTLGARLLVRPGFESALVFSIRALRLSGRRKADVLIGSQEARLTILGAVPDVRYLVHLAPESELTENERRLSPAQLQVGRRAATGATLDDIALALDRSPETVRTHLREVYRRLDVATRLELAAALAKS